MRLLIVDDDAFLREMYALKFGEDEHEVKTAEHAFDALRILQRDKLFDVMLLDMIMPGMSGSELIEKVKQLYPDIHTKFIVLSNQGQQEDIDKATSVGADGYIIKADTVPSEVVKRVVKIVK
jgi:CheY-like chemotaxis protein